MSLTSCSHVSIKGQSTLNHVGGHQVNGTVHGDVIFNTGQAVVKHTKHDEFDYVKLGHVISVKDLGAVEQYHLWDESQGSFRSIKAKKRICTAEIHPDRQSKYTVIMYEGKDAEHIWKEDFQEFSGIKDPLVAQLFGINQSSIPMLIFHNELVPLGNSYKLSFWSTVYLAHLKKNNGWWGSNVWIDARGSLCQGPDGPHTEWCRVRGYIKSIDVPLKAEMFKDDISFRYFLKFGSSVDKAVFLCALHLFKETYLKYLFPWTVEVPLSKYPVWYSEQYLNSLWQNPPNQLLTNAIDGLRFDTVYSLPMEAVARWPKGTRSLWQWEQIGWTGLVGRMVLEGGLTRFTWDLTQGPKVHIRALYSYRKLYPAWFSQFPYIFNALNITEGGENFFFVQLPELVIYSRKPLIKKTPPSPSLIHLFVRPLPESISEFVSWRHQPYFWSFDKTGQSKMSEEVCERWEVPELTCTIDSDFPVRRWPTYVYTAVRDWQEARGFDPTTSDWARSMCYPELEIIGMKKNQGQSEEADVQEEKTGGSWWEAFGGSGISAFGF